jgi:hypothetical protein
MSENLPETLRRTTVVIEKAAKFVTVINLVFRFGLD